jgi:hypothetical protein
MHEQAISLTMMSKYADDLSSVQKITYLVLAGLLPLSV